MVTAGANNTLTSVAPGISGNVLTSNGTDWVSSAAPGGTLSAKITLTSAQIKTLHASPVQIIAAQGANTVINVLSASAKFVYGGTNVFTAAAGQAIGIFYNSTALQIIGSNSFVTNGMIVSSASKFAYNNTGSTKQNQAVGNLSNVGVYAYQTAGTEIGGNAAGDNTIIISVAYWVATLT